MYPSKFRVKMVNGQRTGTGSRNRKDTELKSRHCPNNIYYSLYNVNVVNSVSDPISFLSYSPPTIVVIIISIDG